MELIWGGGSRIGGAECSGDWGSEMFWESREEMIRELGEEMIWGLGTFMVVPSVSSGAFIPLGSGVGLEQHLRASSNEAGLYVPSIAVHGASCSQCSGVEHRASSHPRFHNCVSAFHGPGPAFHTIQESLCPWLGCFP